jgi:hypothetical protein
MPNLRNFVRFYSSNMSLTLIIESKESCAKDF